MPAVDVPVGYKRFQQAPGHEREVIHVNFKFNLTSGGLKEDLGTY